MKKPILCVIFGGKSSEYEVSLRSAYGIITHIDREKYDLVCLGITKTGEWYIFEGEHKEIENGTWESGNILPVTFDLTNGNLIVFDKGIYVISVDLFLPILHGEYGEDGRIQSLLDIAGVKYLGCGPFSSHICMDKALAKAVAQKSGIEVARVFEQGDEISYPVFVKPTMRGSSVGVSLVEKATDLAKAVLEAKKYGDVMVEERIFGNEVEVGILEKGDSLIVSEVGMVKHGGVFYDYDTKYKCEKNQYLIPAPFDKKVLEGVKEHAKALFRLLGCKDLSRFDFFIKKNKDVVFNEVNTMPGFTEKSLFPRLFAGLGLSFCDVVDIMVENVLC